MTWHLIEFEELDVHNRGPFWIPDLMITRQRRLLILLVYLPVSIYRHSFRVYFRLRIEYLTTRIRASLFTHRLIML